MVPSHPTTPDAITGIAKMIMDEFWMMKLDEIMLAFKRGISGRYGKIFGQLSLNVFFDWIHAYNQEQAGDHSEILEQREKENHNKKIEGAEIGAKVFAEFTSNENFKHLPAEQRTGKPISIQEMLEENKKKNIETIEAIKLATDQGIISQEEIDEKIKSRTPPNNP